MERITKAGIGNNGANVGGYLTREEREDGTVITGSASFVDNKEVIARAKAHGLKVISLSGDWSDRGYEGWGKEIPIETAESLIC